jgi:HupE / UreJ protein
MSEVPREPGSVMMRLLTVCLAVLTLTVGLVAHDIPNDVTIQAFVKPEGDRLRLILRVPLQAMRDVNYPSRGPGRLDLARADEALREAATLWIADNIRLYEGETRLGSPRPVEVRASLPSDKSFASYDEALAHVTGPRLPDEAELLWNQGLLDVLFEYPVQSDRADFSIDSAFARLGLRTVTVVRFLPPGGVVRAFEYAGNPGLVRLDPRWHQAAWRFVDLGFFHILGGTDHLLFLFCLVIPFRRFRSLVPVVTAFTAAHSLTLIASAYDMAPGALWFPPLIESLIALSIAYMALENIISPTLRRRWIIAFAFGLVHGFGFSFALRETLQFAGSHLLTSLLSFNVGVEIGQLLVLALLVPALELLFRFVVAERIGTIIVSALVAHTGAHWLLERADSLRQFKFEWPDLTPALLATATRWLVLSLIVAGLVWLVRMLRHHVRLKSVNNYDA